MFRFLQPRDQDGPKDGESRSGERYKSQDWTVLDNESGEIGGPPKTNRAGLLVTKELEEAIQRCRKKVKKLATDCRKANCRYRDIDFDILSDRENCLYGLPNPLELEPIDTVPTPRSEPTDALRATEIFEKPQFFIDGPTASDISQGKLGNCWFMSALAVVATAGLIEKICVERDEKVGIYGFIFWRESGWVDVIIDDLLFLSIPRWQELSDRERNLYKHDQDFYNREARKGSKTLFFSKSLNENETWVPLIEKAYAKLHGDYSSLVSGLTSDAVEDLTGAVSMMMFIQDILDPEVFWKKELMKVNQDRAFGCFIPNLRNPSSEPTLESTNGLVTGHAYSISKAIEYKGKRFLKIRNPWGKYEWNGRWSDGSKQWSGEWLDALKALEYGFDNDGEFIMEYCDFLKTWDIVERCHLFDENWAFSQLWLNVNCGEYPKPTNFGDMSFTLNISKATPAVLVLAQLDSRYYQQLEGPYSYSLYFVLFKAGDSEAFASSRHTDFWHRTVNLDIDLEEGDYIIHVRLDRKLIKNDEAYTTMVANSEARKLEQKRAEKLRSSSIAANFDSSQYGIRLPLSENMFTGVDINTIELTMHELHQKYRAEKKALFGDRSSLTAPEVTKDLAETPKTAESTKTGTSAATKDSPLQAESPSSPPSVVIGPEQPANAVDMETTIKALGVEGSDAGKSSDKAVKDDDAPDAKVAKEASTSTEQSSSSTPASISPPEVVHKGYACSGCGGPIKGSRYQCLDIACRNYNLCQQCRDTNGHVPSHRMIEITKAEDAAKLLELKQKEEKDEKEAFKTENNSLVVGLKVYTRKETQAMIRGQLRHGGLMQHYITMSKII